MNTFHLPGIYAPGEMKQDHRDIASALHMRPADVHNRLAWLRDRSR